MMTLEQLKNLDNKIASIQQIVKVALERDIMDWTKYPNFREAEFQCPCCKRSPMDEGFIRKLQNARIVAGIGFTITSGFRCEKHNKEIGGKPDSSHLRGVAADIDCMSSQKRHAILHALQLVGFNRIGIAKNFIHADTDPNLPSNVIWMY